MVPVAGTDSYAPTVPLPNAAAQTRGCLAEHGGPYRHDDQIAFQPC